MSLSLQVLYPTGDNTTFDHGYYMSKHMAIVGEHMGSFFESTLVTKGLAGGPDVPAGFHVIATMTFADQNALDAALAAVGPILADTPNYYNGQPQMLIGSIVA